MQSATKGHGAQRGADDLPAAADQLSPPWARATQLVQWYRSSGRRGRLHVALVTGEGALVPASAQLEIDRVRAVPASTRGWRGSCGSKRDCSILEPAMQNMARAAWPRRVAVTPLPLAQAHCRYRLRWRWRLLHNDMGRAALRARSCSLLTRATVLRSRWRSFPAMLGTLTCSYVIPFLREASAYEIAVDWRWRRVGDVSWMPAHNSIQGQLGDEHHDLSGADHAVQQHLPCPPCRHQDRCPGNLHTARRCVRGDGLPERHERVRKVTGFQTPGRSRQTLAARAKCEAIIAARLCAGSPALTDQFP